MNYILSIDINYFLRPPLLIHLPRGAFDVRTSTVRSFTSPPSRSYPLLFFFSSLKHLWIDWLTHVCESCAPLTRIWRPTTTRIESDEMEKKSVRERSASNTQKETSKRERIVAICFACFCFSLSLPSLLIVIIISADIIPFYLPIWCECMSLYRRYARIRSTIRNQFWIGMASWPLAWIFHHHGVAVAIVTSSAIHFRRPASIGSDWLVWTGRQDIGRPLLWSLRYNPVFIVLRVSLWIYPPLHPLHPFSSSSSSSPINLKLFQKLGYIYILIYEKENVSLREGRRVRGRRDGSIFISFYFILFHFISFYFISFCFVLFSFVLEPIKEGASHQVRLKRTLLRL